MRILIAVVITLLATAASAQETYSQNATAGNVVELRGVVTADNEDTCEKAGLSESCTQAQACVARNAAGGASCTAAQARAAGVRIYPDSEAGRNEYVLHTYVLPQFTVARARIALRHAIKLCRWWATANTTQKNAVCSAAGQPNGCELCP
jgi:hypothetical protein